MAYGVSARGSGEVLAWYRALRDQCIAANVPFFFKQWGCFAQRGEQIFKLLKKNPENILDNMKWEQYPDEMPPPRPAIAKLEPTKWDRLVAFNFDLDGVTESKPEPPPLVQLRTKPSTTPDFMSF